MAASVRILIDYDKCVGSRICTAISPNVFGLNEDGQASVLDVNGDAVEGIRAAAEECPVSAITVEEVGGEKGTS